MRTMLVLLIVVGWAIPAGAADAPKVGDVVWAQWRPNAWYHCKLDKKIDGGFHVVFDDGDETDAAPALIAVDAEPKKDDLKPGVRVVAPRDGTTAQLATVIKVDGAKAECRLEDHSDASFEIKELRMAAVGTVAAQIAKVGDTVWAQWRPNAWFHGKVAKKVDVGLHVEFDDG